MLRYIFGPYTNPTRQQLIRHIFESHNRIRKNPKQYIPKLEEYLKYFQFNTLYLPNQFPIRTVEGAKAVKECIDFLREQKPIDELVYSRELSQAAQQLANEIGTRGQVDIKDEEAKEISERISKYLKYSGSIGENMAFSTRRADDVLLSLIIDDGNKHRTQRLNVFQPDFKYIGIGVHSHSKYDICTVIDYVQTLEQQQQQQQQQGETSQIQEQQQQTQEVMQYDNVFNAAMADFDKKFKEMENLFAKGFSDFPTFEILSPSIYKPLGFARFDKMMKDFDQIENLPEGAVGKTVKEEITIANGKKHVKRETIKRYPDGKKESVVDEFDE